MSVKPGATVTKDPDAALVYTWDWSAWLVGDAVIDTATFAVDVAPDASLTLDEDDSDDTTASVRINGGTVGKKYQVRCRVVTDETPAQTDDRSIWVHIVRQ